jgi:hypothetical protein
LKYRTGRKKSHGCNVCSGHVIVRGVNDLETLYPEIAKEMDRAENNGVKSYEVGGTVGKRFNFTCELGHTWSSRIDNRTSTGGKCPFCANQRVLPGFNDLASQYPEIAESFDSDKNGTTADQVISQTNKKYFLTCKRGHSFDVALQTVVRLGVTCGYCLNRRSWQGYNDLETKFPDIAKEFDIKLNRGVLPSEVVFGSHKKYWFTCQDGHSWKAVIKNRTNRGDGCPDCSGAGSSTVEREYYKAFEKSSIISVLPTLSKQDSIKVAWRKHSSMRVDVVGTIDSGSIPVAIEYDGSYWHNSSAVNQRDLDKTQALLDAGYLVIRIRENTLSHLPLIDDNLYQLNANYGSYRDDLKVTVEKIETWLETRASLKSQVPSANK